ncbi:hypothetical protein [Streptomyces sp. NPDC002491]
MGGRGRPLGGPPDRPGHDLLRYRRFRPQSAAGAPGPGPDLERVELLPSQPTALRLFTALADRLRVPAADGLAERVRDARREAAVNRHVLYLSPEQMASVAYAFTAPTAR